MLSLRWARGSPALQWPQLWLCSPPASPAPRLDLGKKMSTPQDLMIEELSLRNNRGSQLFQQRQKRMQRFVFEHPSGYREVGLRLVPRLRAGQPFPGSCSLCREVIPGGVGETAGQLRSAARYAEMKGEEKDGLVGWAWRWASIRFSLH